MAGDDKAAIKGDLVVSLRQSFSRIVVALAFYEAEKTGLKRLGGGGKSQNTLGGLEQSGS